MLAVAISCGAPASSAATFSLSKRAASSGCSSEYVPAEPQQRPPSATRVRVKPAVVSNGSTTPGARNACCRVHGAEGDAHWRTRAWRRGGAAIRKGSAQRPGVGGEQLADVQRECADALGTCGVGGIVFQQPPVVT